MTLLAVFLGGGAGSVLRYLVGLGALKWLGDGYPAGTLIANVLGSFLLGLLAHLSLHGRVSDEVRLGLTSGLCGGFTTYSTFNLETLSMLEGGLWLRGGGYLLVTVLLCALAGGAGMWLGSRLQGN